VGDENRGRRRMIDTTGRAGGRRGGVGARQNSRRQGPEKTKRHVIKDDAERPHAIAKAAAR